MALGSSTALQFMSGRSDLSAFQGGFGDLIRRLVGGSPTARGVAGTAGALGRAPGKKRGGTTSIGGGGLFGSALSRGGGGGGILGRPRSNTASILGQTSFR